ncbi:hypothetical protein GOP47_0000958 [Adiantum capillus-veneris]|uniref:Uncharacterized protein n=1 Tax=Adiantum capillus-veneris TaxID=13818 RepID=A0A9D4ZR08_ADICA|nr:hypothetical protein GOP47_0000958 [Adiantum capillus-veneris]
MLDLFTLPADKFLLNLVTPISMPYLTIVKRRPLSVTNASSPDLFGAFLTYLTSKNIIKLAVACMDSAACEEGQGCRRCREKSEVLLPLSPLSLC